MDEQTIIALIALKLLADFVNSITKLIQTIKGKDNGGE